MKKRIYISIILFLFCAIAYNQQLPHYTQFMFNDYVINPAVAGTKKYYEVRALSRFQWVGVVDAPQTISLSINGPHSSKPMGFGGYLYNDVTGPTSRLGIYGTYAYNIQLKNNIRLSMGLSFGVLQNTIDGTKITLRDQNDPVLTGGVSSSWAPDATLGVYAYDEKWYAGFSVFQLFSNNVRIYDEKNGLNKLKQHYNLIGGYKFDISDKFRLEPSAIIKGTFTSPIQLDINARVIYQETAWLGLSYRTQDAISILIGYIHDKKYYFGYAYDIGISQIKSFHSGSHEILIGFRFNELKE